MQKTYFIKFPFLFFIGIFGVFNNNAFANPSGSYKERIECIKNPDFVSKDNKYKFCVKDNGGILKINKNVEVINVKGSVDQVIKNKKVKFIVASTTLIEYKIEREELVEYKCKAKRLNSAYVCKDLSQRSLLGVRPVDFYLNKSLININNKNWQKALQNLNTEIELSNNTESYYLKSLVQFQLGDYLAALDGLNLLLKKENKDIRVINLSSYLKLILEDHNGAIDDLNKLVEINRTLSKKEKIKYKIENLDLYWNKIFFRRGISKVLMGDEEGAIKDFDKSINLYPNFGEAYVQKGLELYFEERNEACINILKGINLGAENNKILLNWDKKLFDSCKSFADTNELKNSLKFENESNKKEIFNLLKKYFLLFPIIALIIGFLILKNVNQND